jgi:hypothetical protein
MDEEGSWRVQVAPGPVPPPLHPHSHFVQVLPTTYAEVMKNIEASRRFTAAGHFKSVEAVERFSSIVH